MKKKENEEQFDLELAKIMSSEGAPIKKKRKFWSKRKKIVTGVLVFGVAAFLVSGFMGKNKEVIIPVSTQNLQKGSIQNRLTVNGPVSGTDSVDVVSNLHAEVAELKIREGERVEKGQLLAVIDSSNLAKELEIAQNAYDLALVNKEQKLKETENEYDKARQDLQTAKKEYDRLAVLVQGGNEPQVKLETAKNTYDDARRRMDSFRVENGTVMVGESYDLEIKNRLFELEKKKEELESAQVVSPIDGTVVRVNTKVGQFADKVEDNKPMFIIENLDELEVEIKISEYSIGQIEIGQPVLVSADMLNGKTVNGVIASISPTGEEKGGGSTERVIPITVKITDPETGLIAGITAKADILLAEVQDAWIAPISALTQDEEGHSFILTVVDGLIHKVPVLSGVENDIQVEIIPQEGEVLSEETVIVTTPDGSYQEGLAVMAVPAQ